MLDGLEMRTCLLSLQYVEKRFNRRLRSCAVALYTVQTLIYCAIQLYGSATTLSDGEFSELELRN